jgi:hypothetical protein
MWSAFGRMAGSWRALVLVIGLAVGLVSSAGQTVARQAAATRDAAATTAAGLVTLKPAAASRQPPTARPIAFATIKGTAVTMANVSLAETRVRLRDARSGKIAGAQLTDTEGVFEWRGLEPGRYIVEVVDESQSVLAASKLVSANGGEEAVLELKLPSDPALIRGLLDAAGPSSQSLDAQAAAAGVALKRPVNPISER